MRYLGRLAMQTVVNINSMVLATYTLDVIETEIIARTLRRLVRLHLQEHAELRACPAVYLATVLSLLLGPADGYDGVVINDDGMVESKTSGSATSAATAASNAGGGHGGKGGKRAGQSQGGKKSASVSAGPMPFCGGGDGFADVQTRAKKVVKSLKLTHKSLWVSGRRRHRRRRRRRRRRCRWCRCRCCRCRWCRCRCCRRRRCRWCRCRVHR
jgi:hypothetical protein